MRLVAEKHLVLSRTNLESLLAKLDGHPTPSQCSIQGGDEAFGMLVEAEEDFKHYKGRRRGVMHPDTEKELRRRKHRRRL